MSAMTVGQREHITGTCKGCGDPLEPSRSNRPRVWCSERCRKSQYAGTCVDCGGPTNGSDGRGPNAASRCAACQIRKQTVWSRDALIAKVHEWVEEHGSAPSSTDWGHHLASAAQRAEYATGRWPNHSLVNAYFGSWNAGLRAAGVEPNRECNRGPVVLDEWRAAIQAGESCASIAARYGVGATAVWERLRIHGTPVSQLRRNQSSSQRSDTHQTPAHSAASRAWAD